MFLVRNAEPDDLEDLFRLSKQAVFLNLPSDKLSLSKLITQSQNSFKEKDRVLEKGRYLVVLEDTVKKRVIGTSSIIAKHGTPSEPHTFFRVLEKKKLSKSLHIGFIHQVLRLGFDHDGPTEIGGLVLMPEYRGHAERLGKFLSLSRFMYIAARPEEFEDNVLAELMPPFTEKGESPIWEALGRKFTNLRYDEADRLSRKNKEFFAALFPEGDIYTCMLDPDARQAIGEVGAETEPVRKMLMNIGFSYKSMIDPFDGGPHYWAQTNKIKPVAKTKAINVEKDKAKFKSGVKGVSKVRAFVMSLNKGQPRIIQGDFIVKGKSVLLDEKQLEVLSYRKGSEVYFLEQEK